MRTQSLLLAAGLTVVAAGGATAAPPAKSSLFLCGPGSVAERVQAGASPVFKSGPADLSSGSTYATQADCDNEDDANGTYNWSLDHATSHISRGNGQQHGTEHGTWTVALGDGSSVAGIYNGRIFLDQCATATSDGLCSRSAGNINSANDDPEGEDEEAAPAPHWVGKYATTVSATDCGDDDGCQFDQVTVLTYRVVGGGQD